MALLMGLAMCVSVWPSLCCRARCMRARLCVSVWWEMSRQYHDADELYMDAGYREEGTRHTDTDRKQQNVKIEFLGESAMRSPRMKKKAIPSSHLHFTTHMYTK